MTTRITEIEIQEPAPPGLQIFKYPFNQGLNVITGLNGSGKTKLLNHIHKKYKGSHEIRFVDLYYRKPLHKYKGDLENIFQRDKDGKILNHDGSDTNWLHTNKSAISDNYLKENIDRDILKEIMNISSKFASFRSQHKDKTWLDLEKKWKESHPHLPWEDINNVFNTFGLNIQIIPESLSGAIEFRNNVIAEITNYPADSLSSGEQVAYSLALWQWGSALNKKSEILIIDEFDAHLNPSLIKNYMNVIRTHFVEKGVQVIMTTHNPLIVNLLKDDELHWMENGRLIKKSKNFVANKLADGLFSARDLKGIFELFGETGERPEKILLVEGKNDEIRILKFTNTDIKILDCKGAPNMPMFVKLPYVQNNDKKPKIVCLLDNDQKGTEVKAAIDQLVVNNKVCGNEVITILVSDINGDRMEEVLVDEGKKLALISKIEDSFK